MKVCHFRGDQPASALILHGQPWALAVWPCSLLQIGRRHGLPAGQDGGQRCEASGTGEAGRLPLVRTTVADGHARAPADAFASVVQARPAQRRDLDFPATSAHQHWDEAEAPVPSIRRFLLLFRVAKARITQPVYACHHQGSDAGGDRRTLSRRSTSPAPRSHRSGASALHPPAPHRHRRSERGRGRRG
jgi:hypothetical protein